MKSRVLWSALLFCGLSGRLWGIPVSNDWQSFPEAVNALKITATNGAIPPSTIFAMANDTLERMPSVHVPGAKLRGWDMPSELPQTPADINRLQESARRRQDSSHAAVPLPVRQAMDRASQMNQEGRMGFGALPDHVMGFYQYLKGRMALGLIKLNEDLAAITPLIGDDLTYSTIVHENTHANDHQDGKLGEKAVITAEVSAFKAEQLWLKIADPYGERVCFLRAKLANWNHRHPCRLFDMASNYLRHLSEVQATGGNEENLRALALRRGYHDGDHERHGPLSS